MSQILGTNVSDTIVPQTTDDTYATHDEQYGKGGYATVSLLTDLSAIKAGRLKAGMRRKVLGDDGTGVFGRIFELNADLVTWTGLKTEAENASVTQLLTYGTATNSGYEQSGYRYYVTGSDGNLLFGISDDVVSKLIVDNVPQVDDLANVVSDLNTTVLKYGTTVTTGYEQSGYLYYVAGSDGSRLFGITDDATPALAVDSLKVDDTSGLAGQLMGPLSGYYGTPVISGYEQSGYRYLVVGSDGNMLFSVTDDPIPQFYVNALKIDQPQVYTSQTLGGKTVTYIATASYEQAGRSVVFTDQNNNEIGGATDAAYPEGTGAFGPFRLARSEYKSGSTFDIFTRRDTNGDMQVYSLDRTLGTVRQLSSPGDGHMNIDFDASGLRAIWATSSSDRWPSNQLRSRRLDASFPVSHLYPKRLLLSVGDSVDQGSIATSGNSYRELLSAALSLPVTTKSIGGQQEWQQAMQLGAIPTFLTIAGTTVGTTVTAVSALGTIHPATGATITQTVVGGASGIPYPNTMLLSTNADNTSRSINGWVVDVNGVNQRATITRTATGGPPSTTETYTVISQTGFAITVASSTFKFIPDTVDQLSYVITLGGGLNDLGQGYFISSPPTAASILADVRAVQDAIVNSFGPASPAFIIQGLYNQASSFTIAGSEADLAIIAHNNDRRAKYPGKFVDRFAILAAGGDGSANDNSDIANHWAPRSLRYNTSTSTYDTIHPNNSGHALIFNGNSAGLGSYALLSRQLAVIPTV